MRALALRNLVVRLGFYGVNDVGELDGVLNEEDRYVIADDIPVSLICVQMSNYSTKPKDGHNSPV